MTKQEMKDLEKFLESQEGQVTYYAHELERIVTALEALNDNQTTIDLLDSERQSIALSTCRLLLLLHPFGPFSHHINGRPPS